MKFKFPDTVFVTKDDEESAAELGDWMVWTDVPGNIDGERIAIYKLVSEGVTKLTAPTIVLKEKKK